MNTDGEKVLGSSHNVPHKYAVFGISFLDLEGLSHRARRHYLLDQSAGSELLFILRAVFETLWDLLRQCVDLPGFLTVSRG